MKLAFRVVVLGLLVLIGRACASRGQAPDPATEPPTLTTAEPYNHPGPRFIPSLWYPVDLHARRLSNTTDAGTLVRLWSLGSTVQGAENVLGPVLGVRTLGLGWVWRLQDSSLMVGMAVVVRTESLFDRQRPLQAMPAVTLSYRLPGPGSSPKP